MFANRFSQARDERELDEELESFIELRTDEMEASGLSRPQARRRALVELGGKESVKERVREQRVGFVLDVLARDTSFALRMLVSRPTFSILAACTLGLGIGASTAVYAVVDAVLLRRLVYPAAHRLIHVSATARDGRQHFSPPDFVDLRRTSPSFAELGALAGRSRVTLGVGAEARPVEMREVTSNFLTVYGLAPHLGRSFLPEDETVVPFEDYGDTTRRLPAGVAMLSYELWRRFFGGDPAVVGQVLTLNFQPYRIVGVAPKGFEALVPEDGDYRTRVDVWALNQMDFPRMPRDVSFLRVVGRLKPGVDLEEAEALTRVFALRQRQAHEFHRQGAYRVEVASLHRSMTRRHAASIWLVFGAVGLFMLISCANLMNLLLARGVGRHKEFAIRMALGSGRARLIRLLVTESLLYAFSGLALGLPLAYWLAKVFVALAPTSLPRATSIGMHGPVVFFAVASALVAALSVSVFPALRFSKAREASALRSSGRALAGGDTRVWERVFVVVEVALAVVLVVGTALLMKSLMTLGAIEPGFRAEHVVTAELSIPSRRYPRYPRADARVRFARRASEALSALPNVEEVGLALVVPLSGQDAGHTFATDAIIASPSARPPAKYRPVTPGYFKAAGTRLIAGRDFTWTDLEQYGLVSIVDENLVRSAWPGERVASAIGKRLRVEVWSTTGGQIHLEPLWTEVVAVAENVRSATLGEPDPETVYLPYGLYAVSELSVMVRSTSPSSELWEPIRGVIQGLDPEMIVFNFRTMKDYVAESTASTRFSLVLLSAFGLTGLALALIGVYGVLSHFVSLRQSEIGLRIALGAQPGSVLRAVLLRGILLVAVGVAAGLLAAAGLSRLLESELFGVSPLDGGVYMVVAVGVLVFSVVASYLPARRACRVDVLEALRAD